VIFDVKLNTNNFCIDCKLILRLGWVNLLVISRHLFKRDKNQYIQSLQERNHTRHPSLKPWFNLSSLSSLQWPQLSPSLNLPTLTWTSTEANKGVHNNKWFKCNNNNNKGNNNNFYNSKDNNNGLNKIVGGPWTQT